MVLIAVTCPYCQSDHITKHGKTETDKQRYRCHNSNCPHQQQGSIAMPRRHLRSRN